MILVLAGTSDGRAIVKRLNEAGFSILVSTATSYGGTLIQERPGVKINSQRLDASSMEMLILKNAIKGVVDATHPYAKVVSKNAMEVCKSLEIPYWRYERESIPYTPSEHVIPCAHFEEVVEYINGHSGNVLMTTGSNQLHMLREVKDKERIYARVLPVVESLKKCEYAGLKPGQIIAMQGPFSKKINEALLEHYNIKMLVTKESSNVGGFLEKIEAGLTLGCTVLVISRPQLEYPIIFEKIEMLIQTIQKEISP